VERDESRAVLNCIGSRRAARDPPSGRHRADGLTVRRARRGGGAI